jgi:hypothetical protein
LCKPILPSAEFANPAEQLAAAHIIDGLNVHVDAPDRNNYRRGAGRVHEQFEPCRRAHSIAEIGPYACAAVRCGFQPRKKAIVAGAI